MLGFTREDGSGGMHSAVGNARAPQAFSVWPNVGANRPAEAGGVSLARDSGEAAARQAYTACRSGSG